MSCNLPPLLLPLECPQEDIKCASERLLIAQRGLRKRRGGAGNSNKAAGTPVRPHPALLSTHCSIARFTEGRIPDCLSGFRMSSPTWHSADRSLATTGLPDSAKCNVVVGGFVEAYSAPGWRRTVMFKTFQTKNTLSFTLTCKTRKIDNR